MEQTTCVVCGGMNDSKRYFCSYCGKLLVSELSNNNIASEAELKLTRIAENLKENPHTDILWNDTIDAYTRKIERIQSLLRVKDAGIDSAELTEKIGHFLKMCREPDFEIAFVGAVKAGKSTLINALLGKNYASTDPNPETAVLTKFRSSTRDYVKVQFYTKDEWAKLWNSVQSNAERFLQLYKELKADEHKAKWVGHKDMRVELSNKEIEAELKKWSSSQSAVHFFVKEIEVGISSLPKDFPKQVVFVDTPGLFDPVEFRSQISIDYIHKANAILVCVKADNLYGEEVKTVESVFSFKGHNRDKVFIIATNWDKLNNVLIDWHRRRKYMVESFTGKAFFPTEEMAKSNILYAASYHYIMCRDYKTIERSQKRQLNMFLDKIQMSVEECKEKKYRVPEVAQELFDVEMGELAAPALQKLKKITNIPRINNVIVTQLVNQYKQLLYGDIKNLYEDILHMVGRLAGERKKSIDERITISQADMLEIEKKVAQTKERRDNIQKAQKQLTAALSSLEKQTQSRLNAIISKLE